MLLLLLLLLLPLPLSLLPLSPSPALLPLFLLLPLLLLLLVSLLLSPLPSLLLSLSLSLLLPLLLLLLPPLLLLLPLLPTSSPLVASVSVGTSAVSSLLPLQLSLLLPLLLPKVTLESVDFVLLLIGGSLEIVSVLASFSVGTSALSSLGSRVGEIAGEPVLPSSVSTAPLTLASIDTPSELDSLLLQVLASSRLYSLGSCML